MSANNKKGCLPSSTSEPGGSLLDACDPGWLRPGTSKLPCQPQGLDAMPGLIIKLPCQPPVPGTFQNVNATSPAQKKAKIEPNTESKQTAKTNNKSKKKPPEETARLKTLVGEMRSMVECPVCLHLPRRGPIPACSNGHIICLTCKEKILERARNAGSEPTCPTCKGALGNHTSLLAARLLEGVAHECKFTGCGQEMTLEDLDQHEKLCQYQLVSCPFDKDHILSLFDLRNHSTTMGCEGIEMEADLAIAEFDSNELRIVSRHVDKGEDFGRRFLYGTDILLKRKSGQVFYFKSESIAGGIHRFEIVTEGSEEECKKIKVQIDIRDSTNQPLFTFTTHPRPLSMDPWGDFGLLVPGASLAKIGQQSPTPNGFYYKVGIQIS